MIKFFRQIRKRLLTENRISKYLLYAIGEIVLVILGILIALSVNNWNEDRRLKTEEQVILKDLKQEMEMNLRALEYVIKENEKSFRGAIEMRALFDDREAFDQMPDSTFASMVRNMNTNTTYDPRYGILNSIISSGRINQLSNKELKYLLASIKEWTVDAMENTMKIEIQRDELLYSTYDNARIIKDGKIVRSGLIWKSFYDHPPFRTLTNALFYFTRMGGLEEERELKETMERIIELIDQSIEK